MTAWPLAPPRPRAAERRPLERLDATDSDDPRHPTLDWACGMAASGHPHPDGRCRDVVPELIVELL